MSAPVLGQNEQGYWVVPRQGANGVQPTVIGQYSPTMAPADMYDPVITRDMFPPGADGDAAYAAAIQASRIPARITTGFDAQGNPVYENLPGGYYPNGRDFSQQALFNFGGTDDPLTAHQNITRNRQAGSTQPADRLALHSRAQVRPDEAFAALAMQDQQGQGFLTDATQRQIIWGLGGPDAVQAMIEAERERLREAGIIPTQTEGMATGDPRQRPGFIPPGAVGTPQQHGSRPEASAAGQPFQGSIGSPSSVQPPQGSIGSPSSDPSRAGARPVPVQTTPPEVPAQESMYAYRDNFNEGGQDVWLEITIPGTQETMNFSGDQVQMVYSQYINPETGQPLNSFDEMVIYYGYEMAAWALINHVSPPQQGGGGRPSTEPTPPTTAPVQEPPERVGGGGGNEQNY